ncbi:MAG: thioredoxin-disulfide reductase [Bdellovibrionales bacterium CG10_big_fil_rev_8_21_14_0_10_45_34]|nr:MAG: thioredoxin-disulfide reductase [Bdellovibrionales bacterium CG10_big_fil_rev_8_21_14_0_10_45_34]
MSQERKVIIIGSGPAGFTAAIYAARARLEPLMFEGDEPGGQLMITTDVENYPGFAEGVTGPALMEVMRKQAARFGTEIITKKVTKVDFSSRPFKVWEGSKEYQAQTVIIATGATAKLLGLESEKRLMGKGVSACATCDGAFFRDVEVGVVGGGDTAMEEALFLTRYASKVYVIHRREELRASKIMAERAMHHPKIEFVWNAAVEEIHGEKEIESVTLKDTVKGTTSKLKLQGLFIAIGHRPNVDVFGKDIEKHETGYIKTVPGSTRTSVEGVFAAGDVQDPTYRQAVTAAGTGCMAAIEAERWLEAQGQ